MNKLQHIAFIMDGNSTWAKNNNKNSKDGYIAGMNTLIDIALLCEARKIKYATFYAFSTENWLRPKNWLDSFFGTAFEFLNNDAMMQRINHMKLVLIGDINRLDSSLRNKLYDQVNHPADKQNKSLVRKHYAQVRRDMMSGVDGLFRKLSDICK